MPYFRVWAKLGRSQEECWLAADDAEQAKSLVALNCEGEAGWARDPASYDCEPNERKTPPPRLIYRRYNAPLTIGGR